MNIALAGEQLINRNNIVIRDTQLAQCLSVVYLVYQASGFKLKFNELRSQSNEPTDFINELPDGSAGPNPDNHVRRMHLSVILDDNAVKALSFEDGRVWLDPACSFLLRFLYDSAQDHGKSIDLTNGNGCLLQLANALRDQLLSNIGSHRCKLVVKRHIDLDQKFD